MLPVRGEDSPPQQTGSAWSPSVVLGIPGYITLTGRQLLNLPRMQIPYLVQSPILPIISSMSARFVKGDYRMTSSVMHMLQELGWQDLQSCHRDLRLALLYKVVMGHVGIQPENVGLVATDDRTINLNIVLPVLQHKHSITLLRFEL